MLTVLRGSKLDGLELRTIRCFARLDESRNRVLDEDVQVGSVEGWLQVCSGSTTPGAVTNGGLH